MSARWKAISNKIRTKHKSACASDKGDELCFESDSNNQDGHDEVDGHENIVESSDGAVQVLHGVLDRQLFAMELHTSYLELVTGNIRVGVLVKYRERGISVVRSREEPLDILDGQIFGARFREGVEESSGKLLSLVSGWDSRFTMDYVPDETY